MEKQLIYNAKVVLRDRILDGGSVVVSEGRIEGIEAGKPVLSDAREIDAGGKYLTPGFIDLHTHGAGGSEFMDSTVEDTRAVARMHLRHGTTLLFPTTLASTNEELFSFIDIYEKVKSDTGGAAFGGLHLEGPYFAYEYRGAQDPRYLRNPAPEEYLDILERTPDIVRWDMAPELPGALAFGDELCRRGILPSIAHTAARYEDVEAAYAHGFTHMTHFYSCMRTYFRENGFRRAGCVEAGFDMDGITLEVIADGCHIPTQMLHMVVKIKGPERVALITDSMRAAGMGEGPSIIGSRTGGQAVIVEDGVAKLPDRQAFAGSVATGDRLVRTMWKGAGVPLTDTIRMAAETPASIMGIRDKGVLERGYDADLVTFDEDVRIDKVWIKGKQYDI